MPNVPLSTRFVGFSTGTDLQERKSANINALSQPFTMQDIANTVGGASAPSFEYTYIGSETINLKVDYITTIGDVLNLTSGQHTIQSYYSPSISLGYPFTGTSITFPTQILSSFRVGDINNPQPGVGIINFPNLTGMLYSLLAGDYGINIRGLSSLTTVSTPLATSGFMRLEVCNSLTTVDISNATNLFILEMNNCSSITLDGISFDDQFSYFYLSNCDGLESTISLVATDIYTSISYCVNLTDLSFPNAVNYYNGYFYGDTNLENVSLGSIGTVKNATTGFNFQNCALSSASVTHILDILVSLDGTNGTNDWGATNNELNIAGGTNAIPSAGDLVKIATLEARGATINYNS
jgi:hypothetical protein